MKNAIDILIWIALNLLIALHIALGSVVILTILPINEHNVSFHLLVSSSISFMSVSRFSEYRSFTSLVKFNPSYFFYGIIKNLISLSDSSLVYRNAIDFYMLIFFILQLHRIYPWALVVFPWCLWDSIGMES